MFDKSGNPYFKALLIPKKQKLSFYMGFLHIQQPHLIHNILSKKAEILLNQSKLSIY